VADERRRRAVSGHQRGPKTVVIVDQERGCVGGCLTVFLVLVAIGLSVKYWYITIPIIVLAVAVLALQSHRSGVPMGSRVDAWLTVAKTKKSGVGSPFVPGTPENVVIVKQKRGCTCCGTGCVLMTAIGPLTVFGLWGTFGALIALLAWPVGLGLAHAVRFTLAAKPL
jgi:hypothetical protein